MTSRKHPSTAIWTTVVLVAVLVAYPLSVGPVDWLVLHGYLPEWAWRPFTTFYSPVAWFVANEPKPRADAMRSCIDIWTGHR